MSHLQSNTPQYLLWACSLLHAALPLGAKLSTGRVTDFIAKVS
jgi:hypothetical protein